MKIITSWDDGCASDARVAGLLAKYNLPGIFFVPAMWESFATQKGWKPLTQTELLQISEQFEIGAHGVTHTYLTKIPYEMQKFEIEQGKVMLEDMIHQPVTKFAYPRGYATDQIRDLVRPHYEYARSTLVGSLQANDDPVWQHSTVHVYNRTEYNDVGWFDYAMRMLGKAKEDSVFSVWGHSWELDKYDYWQGLETLFKELSGVSS